MIFEYYMLYKETGNIEPFYNQVLKLSQIQCRKLGFNYEREEISITVASEMFIALAQGKLEESKKKILTYIWAKTKSLCFYDTRHPIYSRTTFIPLEYFDFEEIRKSVIPMGSEVISKRWRTEEYINEVRKYAETHTTKECAERFGYKYEAMRSLKVKYKIKTKKELRPFESIKNEALEWVKAKPRSLEEIMDQFNISKHTAFLFMKKNKIAVRKPESKCKEFDKQIREMRKVKATWQYIADTIGVKMSTLYSYVKKENIK